MYILKNAIKNLGRNKGRSFIVLLIALLTLTSVTLSFSVKTISDLAVTRYQDSFRVDATIDYDWEKAEKDFPPKTIENEDGSITQESTIDIPEISFEDYMKYADSQYVKGTKYYAACSFASDRLTAVLDNNREGEEWLRIDGMTLDEIMRHFKVSTKKELFDSGIIDNEDELQRILNSKRNLVGTLVGYTDLSVVDDFADNANKLKSGHFPEHDNECIVSSKYAEHNKLNIGDTFSVSGPDKSDTEDISLTITGIYDAHRLEASAVSLGDLYGYVYTTFNTLKNSGFHYIWVEKCVYQLGSLKEAGLFGKELHEKGLSKYRILSYSNSGKEYTKNTRPLKNISRIAEIFTLAASIVGAAILLLISFFNIRERKYEIGVLRAMGMKKSGVARGMVYETLIIMFIGFALSVLSGMALTKPVAAALLGDLTKINITLPPVALIFGAVMAFLFSILAGLCSVFAVMLTLENISYRYTGTEKAVLNKISYAFEIGRLYCVTGSSGEGKTTLLSLMAGLDLCSSGRICCENQDITLINRDEYRSKKVGVVFQSYNLLQNATAAQNISLSMNIAGKQGKQTVKEAYAILKKVGIEHEKADRKILKLSGGEQQRVAIARAIANSSPILIADEPTGNLDTDNEQAIMDIFKRLAHEENKCVIVVTHSKRVASEADIVLTSKNGELLM